MNYKRKIVILFIPIILCVFVACAQKKKVNAAKENCGNTKNTKTTKMDSTQINVLGLPLMLASKDPLTGYFRTGYCNTDATDRGLHVVAAVVTDAFLQYSKANGNDLISPYPASNFPGLVAGNVWCLCVLRWKEALAAGVAPPIILEATNIKALQYVTLEELQKNSIK